MDRLLMSLLILRKFERITSFLCPLKSLENQRFSEDFRGERSSLIRLNSLNIRSIIWKRSFIIYQTGSITGTFQINFELKTSQLLAKLFFDFTDFHQFSIILTSFIAKLKNSTQMWVLGFQITIRSSRLQFFQKSCSQKFCNIYRKTPVLESLFNKLTSTRVLSCEYYIISENTFFHRTPPVAAFPPYVSKKL